MNNGWLLVVALGVAGCGGKSASSVADAASDASEDFGSPDSVGDTPSSADMMPTDAADTQAPDEASDQAGDGAGLLETIADTSEEASADTAGDASADWFDELFVQVDPSWAQCNTSDFSGAYPSPGASVLCAFVEVPADYENPAAGKVTLRVARQMGPEGADGIFFVAGGPGGSAVEQSGVVPAYLPGITSTFDLVYVDQRGTGGSGYLGCTSVYPDSTAEWLDCFEEHAAKDLSHHLTLDSARDLEWIRRTLGYPLLNMRGGSYGTRVGLEYRRQFPGHAGMIVLDGLAPPDIDLFGGALRAPNEGIQWLIDECSADPACVSVSPTFEADLAAWRALVGQNPRPVLVGGAAYVEDEQVFVDTISGALYTSVTRYPIPGALHAALQGDTTLWNGLMSEVYGVTIVDDPGAPFLIGFWPQTLPRLPAPKPVMGDSPVSPAILELVACTEWFPNSGGLDALIALAESLAWVPSQALSTAEACSAWSLPFDASLAAPVQYDGPVLLLTGQWDLNTMPEFADQALKTLPGANQVTVPFATHSVLSTKCGASITKSYFMSKGDFGQLDTSCLSTVKHHVW